MGQFTLGLRSLLIKATIFVIMAALLAWALGGTLWPRPHVAELQSSGVAMGQAWYYWSVMIADRKQSHATWRMVVVPPAQLDLEAHFADDHRWSDGAGPVSAGDTLFYGGRDFQGLWHLVGLKSASPPSDMVMPDRLAIEQQLARLAAGLALPDAETIERQRSPRFDSDPGAGLHSSTKPADD